MSSKHVNPHANNLTTDNSNQKSSPCAVANRLSSSHHVRHHSYDPTSTTLASQIFPPSRLNRKENSSSTNTNENSHAHFLPPRSSHRHTSSCASDRSLFTNLNSNHYHQHNYSASQENLRRKFDLFLLHDRKKKKKG